MSPPPVRHDLDVLAGDTHLTPRWAVIVRGEPVDLTGPGWSVLAQLRRRDTDPDTACTATVRTTAPVVVAGQPTMPSTVALHLSPTATRTLAGLSGVWELQISHPTHDQGVPYVRTVAGGTWRGRWDVARDT